ncbi:MAG: hypothetical protein KDA61_15430 [Planctomycetales bacterium]|nr:hypothetical protein [Planctomycetales bacterium]
MKSMYLRLTIAFSLAFFATSAAHAAPIDAGATQMQSRAIQDVTFSSF